MDQFFRPINNTRVIPRDSNTVQSHNTPKVPLIYFPGIVTTRNRRSKSNHPGVVISLLPRPLASL